MLITRGNAIKTGHCSDWGPSVEQVRFTYILRPIFNNPHSAPADRRNPICIRTRCFTRAPAHRKVNLMVLGRVTAGSAPHRRQKSPLHLRFETIQERFLGKSKKRSAKSRKRKFPNLFNKFSFFLYRSCVTQEPSAESEKRDWSGSKSRTIFWSVRNGTTEPTLRHQNKQNQTFIIAGGCLTLSRNDLSRSRFQLRSSECIFKLNFRA